jgi:hypothetical protein
MLSDAEIVAGAVANLNGDQLLSDGQVAGHTWSIVGKVGVRPFLCVRVDGNHSEWLELTRAWSKHRLCIDEWKQPGSTKWMSDSQYVMDARQVLSGPNSSFIQASKDEMTYRPPGRPSLNSQGVERVIEEMANYT